MTTVQRPSERHPPRRRVPLLDASVALVEDVGTALHEEWASEESFSPAFQVALPYRGVFVWEVGRDAVVGDPNQVLFVAGGEAFRMRQPLPGGYAELIVTPGAWVLEELTRSAHPRVHPLFHRRSRTASPRLQLLRARLLASAPGWTDGLEAEEQVLSLLRAALAPDEEPRFPPARSTQRLLERTKTYLASRLDRSIRLLDIARAVGASPGYLTQLFRAVEGVPLHGYLTRLRLARALVELPHAEDLTGLALELGFSSHSHFSARFRRAFGLTPSDFRRGCRPRGVPLPV